MESSNGKQRAYSQIGQEMQQTALLGWCLCLVSGGRGGGPATTMIEKLERDDALLKPETRLRASLSRENAWKKGWVVLCASCCEGSVHDGRSETHQTLLGGEAVHRGLCRRSCGRLAGRQRERSGRALYYLLPRAASRAPARNIITQHPSPSWEQRRQARFARARRRGAEGARCCLFFGLHCYRRGRRPHPSFSPQPSLAGGGRGGRGGGWWCSVLPCPARWAAARVCVSVWWCRASGRYRTFLSTGHDLRCPRRPCQYRYWFHVAGYIIHDCRLIRAPRAKESMLSLPARAAGGLAGCARESRESRMLRSSPIPPVSSSPGTPLACTVQPALKRARRRSADGPRPRTLPPALAALGGPSKLRLGACSTPCQSTGRPSSSASGPSLPWPWSAVHVQPGSCHGPPRPLARMWKHANSLPLHLTGFFLAPISATGAQQGRLQLSATLRVP